MSLVERYILSLFPAYRDMLITHQQLADECLHLRARNTALEEKVDSLIDRLININSPKEVALPVVGNQQATQGALHRSTGTNGQNDASTPTKWKARQTSKFFEDLAARAQKLRAEAEQPKIEA